MSWGLGALYRTVDVLFTDLSRNKQAGKSDSRNVWLLSVSQSLGGGFAAEAAVTLPLPTSVTVSDMGVSITGNHKLTAGVTIRKSISSGPVKSIHLFASANDAGEYVVAAAMAASPWADITAGIETRFRRSDDFRATLNAMKLHMKTRKEVAFF